MVKLNFLCTAQTSKCGDQDRYSFWLSTPFTSAYCPAPEALSGSIGTRISAAPAAQNDSYGSAVTLCSERLYPAYCVHLTKEVVELPLNNS
jgi:hypothetical protein